MSYKSVHGGKVSCAGMKLVPKFQGAEHVSETEYIFVLGFLNSVSFPYHYDFLVFLME